MRRSSETARPSLLEQIDLVLAERHAAQLRAGGAGQIVGTEDGGVKLPIPGRYDWISGLLALRGMLVTPDEVGHIVAGSTTRYAAEHQEYRLVGGFSRLFDQVLAWTDERRALDGWELCAWFREATDGLPRFDGQTLRSESPWDGLAQVDYPPPDEIVARIDSIAATEAYGEEPGKFAQLHPLRQGWRLLWSIARLAPFPDFNLPLAFVAMSVHFRASGYPLLAPMVGDRMVVERLIRGGAPPQQMVRFEKRILSSLALAP